MKKHSDDIFESTIPSSVEIDHGHISDDISWNLDSDDEISTQKDTTILSSRASSQPGNSRQEELESSKNDTLSPLINIYVAILYTEPKLR